eukprot:4680272-Lingulodinium_polyedra.AAC.1
MHVAKCAARVARCTVHGPCTVHGARCARWVHNAVYGAWCTMQRGVHGAGRTARGAWSTARGGRRVARGARRGVRGGSCT